LLALSVWGSGDIGKGKQVGIAKIKGSFNFSRRKKKLSRNWTGVGDSFILRGGRRGRFEGLMWAGINVERKAGLRPRGSTYQGKAGRVVKGCRKKFAVKSGDEGLGENKPGGYRLRFGNNRQQIS